MGNETAFKIKNMEDEDGVYSYYMARDIRCLRKNFG